MVLFKCKMCGGDLGITEGLSVAECEYCGTKQAVPKAIDENLQNLFNRANILRIKGEFDKAEKLYEKIIQADTTQSDAYWGLILCKYGIEYVDDPVTFKKIPTCHRASYDSIIADEDYKSAIEYADGAQRAIYEKQASEIDRIQKDILALAQREESYDVFICYKETDASGQRTQDSVIANDIYYQLTNEGFKVFYAAITLEGKIGSAYEPIIFAALNSAKVMLAIGTKSEYFNAVWVKNEWSRYLKIIKKDRSKLLIPCYRDMNAYELPEEFAHLQAQDMGKIGFINDVVRGIKKVITKEESKSEVHRETLVSTGNSNTTALLKRAFMFLEDGDWTSANEYCEKVLDIDPENAMAYLGKLMAELQVKNRDSLKEQTLPFDDKNNYHKVIRFADDELKSELVGCIEYINSRNEKLRFDTIYYQAINIMKNVENGKEQKNIVRVFKWDDKNADEGVNKSYEAAMKLFESISGWKDADERASQCKKIIKEREEKAEIFRKDAILEEGIRKMAGGVSECQEAIRLFASIPGWKNADEKKYICKNKIEKIKASAKKRVKIIKIMAFVVIMTICVIVATTVIIKKVIIPNSKYNNAIELMNEGNIVEAYEALLVLDGYKDSIEKANSIYDKYKIEKLKVANVGDYVILGTYEQDNIASNGKEDIEWLVLDEKDGKALLVSKYALDCKSYNNENKVVTWETCTLREWLNGGFINNAFSTEEKNVIPTVTASADENLRFDTDPGNATQDQIFLLSTNEVNKYLNSNKARQCKPTAYAMANGAYIDSSSNCWWWLRSPGDNQRSAARVYYDGRLLLPGFYVDDIHGAVRPALWIDLNS